MSGSPGSGHSKTTRRPVAETPTRGTLDAPEWPTRGHCIVRSHTAQSGQTRKPMTSNIFHEEFEAFSARPTRNRSLGLIFEAHDRECLRKENPEGRANKSIDKRVRPIGSVRDRFRSAEPFRFFDLPGPVSVSGFGLGISVDGSIGKPLGILQLTDS